MAQKIITQLIDDLTGDEITEGKGETVAFAVDGVSYEIDLSAASADKLRGALLDYVAKARRVGNKTGKAGIRTQIGPSAGEIRAWAVSNGYEVPDRGRIPAAAREAFEAAH